MRSVTPGYRFARAATSDALNLLRAHSARGHALRLHDLDERARAVIGGQHDNRVVEADRGVDVREQPAQKEIQAQHLVHLLVAVRSPLVADAIGRGESNRKDVGIRVLSELVPFHRLEREVQGEFVGERRAPQLDVVLCLRRLGREHVRKGDVLAIALAFDGVLARVFSYNAASSIRRVQIWEANLSTLRCRFQSSSHAARRPCSSCS